MKNLVFKGRLFFALLLVLLLTMSFVGCADKKGKDDEFQPTSGLALTDEEAAALNGKVRVTKYFPTTAGDELVGEVTLLDFTSKDKKVENLIIKVVNSLISGPKDTTTLKKVFPNGTEVRNVKIIGDSVTITFNDAFKAGIPETQSEAEVLLYSLANTITEFKDFNSIKVLSGDEVVQAVVTRNMEIVSRVVDTDVDDYSEEAFADVPLE